MIFILVLVAVVTCIYAYPSKCSKVFDKVRSALVFVQHPETKLVHKECALALKSKVVPDDVQKGIKEKLRCLAKMNPDRDVATLSMFWIMKKKLEKLCSIPWGIYTNDNLNGEDVKSKLESSIFGVQRLKDRVLEYVSISNLKNESTGFSVWLIAGVGQGKETCARAVAAALNRSFVSISMKDLTADSIKGTRTEAGAIAKALIKSNCMNPVIYLKEFGELKQDDASVAGRQALMEVRKILASAHLSYKDGYIGYKVDISKVIFVVGSTYTPSYSSTIDGEYCITFGEHNEAQRNDFLTKWLIPKSTEEVGLKPGQLEIKPEVVKVILDDYIGSSNSISYQKMITDTICRRAATKVKSSVDTVTIDADNMHDYLTIEKRYNYDSFEHPETILLDKECSLALSSKLLPDDIDKGIKEKLRSLKKINPDRDMHTLAMFTATKNQLEKVCSIPWGIYTNDNLNAEYVQSKLESSLYGVQRLKDRVLEYVSISNLKNETTGFSLWLIGSVGQGKETCARAVASALNRSFVPISTKDLTGDSFKGSKTGAGVIVEALITSQCMNPVIYLKEFNELKHDDASMIGRQALMEVRKILSSGHLPYKDDYIGYTVDISKVIFIVGSSYTPGYTSTIDGEYGISLYQHNEAQRNEFLTKWLIPKSMEEVGIKLGQLEIKPEAVKVILDDYIGCWNVISYQKMIIDTICRKAATKVTNSNDTVTIDVDNLHEYLILEKRYHYDSYEFSDPGIVACISGSTYRIIETSIVRPLRDRGVFSMSGQPGLNLKETMNTAKAVANMVLKDTELENSINDNHIHMNFPRQSGKKDDTEMGLGVLVALLSLVSKTTIPKGTLFCGELTLSQTILGDSLTTLRNRLITAQKRNCKRLFLSTQSEKQWGELEPALTEHIEPVFIKNVSDIISSLFASSELSKRNDLLHMYN